MNTLYMVAGVPGSGKSTLAQRMLANGQIDCYFEADMYFSQSGEYRFDPTVLPEAHAWCQKNVSDALVAGKNVAVCNTFTRRWEREIYFDMSFDIGNEVEFIKCEGNYQNIHGVPDWKVQQMKDRWED